MFCRFPRRFRSPWSDLRCRTSQFRRAFPLHPMQKSASWLRVVHSALPARGRDPRSRFPIGPQLSQVRTIPHLHQWGLFHITQDQLCRSFEINAITSSDFSVGINHQRLQQAVTWAMLTRDQGKQPQVVRQFHRSTPVKNEKVFALHLCDKILGGQRLY
jgi:hypothetical protein